MRIEILTDDNPLYVLPFFEEFLRHYGREFEIVRLSSCRPMGKRPRGQLIRELMALYGGVGFVKLASRIAAARLLGIIPLGRSAGRFFTLRQLCRAYDIPFGPIGNPNDPDFVAGVGHRGADLILSVACPYILKPALLDLPPMGCINIHSAKLPNYKGMMPTFWQMLHGEQELGMTIHYMTSGIDQGAIILQESMRIEPRESLHHLIQRSKRFGAHCMARVLRDLAGAGRPALAAAAGQGSYFTFPTLAEIREFRQRGLRAI